MPTELAEKLLAATPPATPEQRKRGWTRNWSVVWRTARGAAASQEEHDALMARGGYPPSEEQRRERGWTQDWDKWRCRESTARARPQHDDGHALAAARYTRRCHTPQTLPSGGVIEYFDFSGGALVVAAREAARREEEEAEQRMLKGLAAELRAPTPAPPKTAVYEPDVQQTAQLSNGASIPLIGLGTWKSGPGEVQSAVQSALTTGGYRHIDCASIYENEGEVGAALASVFASTTLVRERVFVTSKLWNSDHAPARVEVAARKSLAALRLSYLDLYLIHWPVTGSRGPVLHPSIVETWRAMEELVLKGLVRAIGVSNFSPEKMQLILDAKPRVPLSVCQVECHPYLRQERVRAFCERHGIHFTAYSPLGSPDSASIFKRSGPPLLEDARVAAVAEKHRRSAAQVLIRWALQARPGCSVLPKSSNPERLRSNLHVHDFSLDDDDMAALSSIPTQQRMVHGSMWLSPQGPYKTLRDLWDEDP